MRSHRYSLLALSLFACNSHAQSWEAPTFIEDFRPIHMILLKSGRLLTFDAGLSPNNGVAATPRAYLVDLNESGPVTLANLTPVPITQSNFGSNSINMFCSGHIHLPDRDATVFFAGGNRVVDGVENMGTHSLVTFNESAAPNYWERVGEMDDPRWYPEVTITPAGKLFVNAGTRFTDTDPPISSDMVTQLPGNRFFRARLPWPSPLQTSVYYPHTLSDPLDPNYLVVAGGQVQGKRYNLVSNAWENHIWSNNGLNWKIFPVYPTVTDIDGLVIKTGQHNIGGYDRDRGAALYVDLNTNPLSRFWFDKLNGESNGPVDPAIGRRNHIPVILPNKDLMLFAGNRFGLFETEDEGYFSDDKRRRQPELFHRDPVTGQYSWTVISDSASVDRGYHVAGMLLPSGNIIIAGSEPIWDLNKHSFEVYRPPYQQIPNKPVIPVANSTTLYYGEPISAAIDVHEGRSIESVVLITMPTVTHGHSFGHRLITLDYQNGQITPPSLPQKATPGWYMMFATDSAGAVSQGKIVRLTERWSRNVPSSAKAQAVVGAGLTEDLFQSDYLPIKGGRATGRYTLTRRTASGSSANLEFFVTVPPTGDTSRGVRLRLEHSIEEVVSGMSVVLQMQVNGGWENVSLVDEIRPPTATDSLQQRVLNSLELPQVAPGNHKFRLRYFGLNAGNSIHIDELQVGVWQSDAE